MNSPKLVELSVGDFVAAVASAEQPVPAGGSVAALTGASSAALLALVCEVLQRHSPGLPAQALDLAQRLQHALLELVDADATAFRAFLDAERGSAARRALATTAASAPLRIGQACLEVLELAQSVEPHVHGAMHLDVAAARRLAQAAAHSALDIAEHNLRLVAEPNTREALEAEISALRGRAS
jgi:formiminotetrahydrofolate cyclodeaminase